MSITAGVVICAFALLTLAAGTGIGTLADRDHHAGYWITGLLVILGVVALFASVFTIGLR